MSHKQEPALDVVGGKRKAGDHPYPGERVSAVQRDRTQDDEDYRKYARAANCGSWSGTAS